MASDTFRREFQLARSRIANGWITRNRVLPDGSVPPQRTVVVYVDVAAEGAMGQRRVPVLLRGTLDMMVLRTLVMRRDHGSGIGRRIRQSSGNILQIEEGSLYPSLHRLEKTGCVSSSWGQSEANRRAKYYKLTRLGRTRLRRESERWSRLSTAVKRVMSRKV